MVKQSIKSIATAAIAVTLFLAGATLGRAQNYPVQAFATLTPPYSLKLSDYAAPEGNRLRVNLLLKDALQPSLDVRLRLVIEGNGVRLATRPGYQPQPITLLSNSLHEVDYSELSDYFLPQNLTAEGMSLSALTASGLLPEGLYKFKVEALEAHRDVPVSNTAVAVGWLMLNDPPQWLSPRPGQKLTAGMPQGIQLSWTRSGMSSPNAALSTQYEVTLVEMTQPGMDPNVAITALPPLYQDVSPSENLFYGPDKPDLIPGNTYAVRVRAFDTRGFDLYRSGGYSPVITFRYGEPCHAPVFLQADKVSEQTAALSWNTPPQATGYRVRYRENGTDLSDWYEEQAAEASLALKSLKPGCTYEYQVQSMCGTLPSDYSTPATLKTKKLENRTQSCSEKVTTANMPTNREPLPALRAGQTFMAGAMPVTVTAVKGSGGTFTGTGDAFLPVVGVGLTCAFKDVGINTEYQLISGEVVTTRSMGGVLFDDSNTQPVKDEITLTNPIDTIIIGPNGDVVVVAGGDTTRIPIANQPVVIYPPTGGSGTATGTTAGTTTGGGTGSTGGDTSGGGPLIVENGTVKPYTPASGGIDGKLPTAKFLPASGSQYGYDSLAHEALRSYYRVATVHGKEVGIPYKAVAVGGQPEPLALEFLPGATKLTLDSLQLDAPGSVTASILQKQGSRMTVGITGLSENEEPLSVFYTRKGADGKPEPVDIGVAQLVTYQPKPMKLVVVPLKGMQAPAEATLAKELTDIYGQAVCSWSVDVVEPFAYTLPAEGLKYGGSQMASSYTAEMNALIDAYKTANSSLPEDTYYLFVVPAITDGVSGYMPRARRFGFIAQGSADARTVAHELGHGAFNLEHTFPVLPRATTDNLMDYNDGKRLIKPQWDLIHNPELTTGLLDDESEGAYEIVSVTMALPDGVKVAFTDKIHIKALANFLSTEEGCAFIGRFMKANTKLYGHTFNKNGDRVNDILLLISADMFDQKHPSNPGLLGKFKSYTKNGVFQTFNIQSENEVLKGFRHVIKLDIGLSEVDATIILGHEAFVHGDNAAKELNRIDKNIRLKKYQKIEKIQLELKAMESLGDKDHDDLGKGLVASLERFIIAMSKSNKEYVSKYKDHKDDY